MKRTTPGSLAFCMIPARDPSKTQVKTAEELGTSQQNVGRWRAATARPSYPMRKKIERLYGIPADDWMTAEERAEAVGARCESVAS